MQENSKTLLEVGGESRGSFERQTFLNQQYPGNPISNTILVSWVEVFVYSTSII